MLNILGWKFERLKVELEPVHFHSGTCDLPRNVLVEEKPHKDVLSVICCYCCRCHLRHWSCGDDFLFLLDSTQGATTASALYHHPSQNASYRPATGSPESTECMKLSAPSSTWPRLLGAVRKNMNTLLSKDLKEQAKGRYFFWSGRFFVPCSTRRRRNPFIFHAIDVSIA